MTRRIGLAILLFSLAGCVDSDAERMAMRKAAFSDSAQLQTLLREKLDKEENFASGALVFRLAFDSTADLDLYVTDPLLETVYFANHETQSGGEIVNDVRCSTPDLTGRRIEEIRFDQPYPGRYRVGVDFPERCDGDDRPTGYAVSVVGAGISRAARREARGSIELKQFEVVVLEFDLEGEAI